STNEESCSKNSHPVAQNNLAVLKKLRKTISFEKLIVQKADKGKCVAVLDKDDYSNKANIKKFLYKSAIFSELDIFSIYPMNPVAPRLHGLPKIHKPNFLIRPVVSGKGSPSASIHDNADSGC
ncbi:hypothetical protein J437_LFUL018706, partial [Ladona fulva]